MLLTPNMQLTAQHVSTEPLSASTRPLIPSRDLTFPISAVITTQSGSSFCPSHINPMAPVLSLPIRT